MEKSTEIRDLILRSYQAMTAGDMAFLERHISHEPDTTSIGTDPGEWWVGFDTIVRIARAQYQEMGGSMSSVKVVNSDPQAFQEGTVGWVADHPTFEMPGGIQIASRMTAVFHQEDGAWKIVQQHISMGVRNEDLLGMRLTRE